MAHFKQLHTIYNKSDSFILLNKSNAQQLNSNYDGYGCKVNACIHLQTTAKVVNSSCTTTGTKMHVPGQT